MTGQKHIRIIIAADGQCAVDAINFTDGSCLHATKEIRAALGGRTVQEQFKPEARFRERSSQGEREGAR